MTPACDKEIPGGALDSVRARRRASQEVRSVVGVASPKAKISLGAGAGSPLPSVRYPCQRRRRRRWAVRERRVVSEGSRACAEGARAESRLWAMLAGGFGGMCRIVGGLQKATKVSRES